MTLSPAAYGEAEPVEQSRSNATITPACSVSPSRGTLYW